jgi:hypothetical protein
MLYWVEISQTWSTSPYIMYSFFTYIIRGKPCVPFTFSINRYLIIFQSERRLYVLREQLKIQYKATQKAQINERQAADSKRRLTSCVSTPFDIMHLISYFTRYVFHDKLTIVFPRFQYFWFFWISTQVRVPLNTARVFTRLPVCNLQWNSRRFCSPSCPEHGSLRYSCKNAGNRIQCVGRKS